jgi:hypothetical protein
LDIQVLKALNSALHVQLANMQQLQESPVQTAQQEDLEVVLLHPPVQIAKLDYILHKHLQLARIVWRELTALQQLLHVLRVLQERTEM